MTYNFDQVIDRSNFNAEKYILRKTIFGTDNVLPMWVADMDIASPPFVLEAIKQRAEHNVLGYEDNPKSAISAQISWLKKRQNFTVEPSWVLSSHSTVASIHMAIQAFSEPLDEVVIMTPVYHAFARSVKQENRTLINWEITKDKQQYSFSLEQLKIQISSKTKLLILCSPHNPLGRIWRFNELKAIGEFCIEHNIIIVADEVHADLIYTPNQFIPMATISPEIAKQCITLQGPGKAFNLTGIGLASVIISNDFLRKKFKLTHQRFHPSYGNAFAQVAFEAAYTQGEAWLDELLLYLNKNQQSLNTMLDSHRDKISIHIADATYLAWLDCRNLNMSERELQIFFIEKAKLGLSAGKVFGAGGEQHMRLNFAVPHSIMLQAVEQLDTALKGL